MLGRVVVTFGPVLQWVVGVLCGVVAVVGYGVGSVLCRRRVVWRIFLVCYAPMVLRDGVVCITLDERSSGNGYDRSSV